MFVATVHELEEEHGASMSDRQIADLIDDQQRRMREDGEAAGQMAGGLRFLKRGDQIDQRAVVDATSALRRLDCEADCEVRLAHTGWAEQHYVLFALDKA